MMILPTLFLARAEIFKRDYHEDEVYRCDDSIVDTGKRDAEGRMVLRLMRENCRWEPFDEPPLDYELPRKYDVDDDE